VVGKIIYLRSNYHFGPQKIAMYLKRYHDIEISPSGVWRILKGLDMNRLPASQRYKRHKDRWKRYEKALPGHRVQVDVKFIEPIAGSRKKHYQFTAIDDCTRIRVLRIYVEAPQQSAGGALRGRCRHAGLSLARRTWGSGLQGDFLPSIAEPTVVLDEQDRRTSLSVEFAQRAKPVKNISSSPARWGLTRQFAAIISRDKRWSTRLGAVTVTGGGDDAPTSSESSHGEVRDGHGQAISPQSEDRAHGSGAVR
jgi:hypothetical protein